MGRRGWTWSPGALTWLTFRRNRSGAEPGRAGSRLTSLQHRPLRSWRPGAQLAGTRDLQPGAPSGSACPWPPFSLWSSHQAAGSQGAEGGGPDPGGSAEAWGCGAVDSGVREESPAPFHRGLILCWSRCFRPILHFQDVEGAPPWRQLWGLSHSSCQGEAGNWQESPSSAALPPLPPPPTPSLPSPPTPQNTLSRQGLAPGHCGLWADSPGPALPPFLG